MNVLGQSSRMRVLAFAVVAIGLAGCTAPGTLNPLALRQQNQQLRAALYRYREELAETKRRLATYQQDNRQLQRLLAEEQGRTVALRQQLQRLGMSVPDYYPRSVPGRSPTATAAAVPGSAGAQAGRAPVATAASPGRSAAQSLQPSLPPATAPSAGSYGQGSAAPSRQQPAYPAAQPRQQLPPQSTANRPGLPAATQPMPRRM